ncbi:MAG: DUF11 domain-containing protein [Anaerolineae bacterium]|nr:DUF11 domain-containing protein [Anaerolineae bacterium]
MRQQSNRHLLKIPPRWLGLFIGLVLMVGVFGSLAWLAKAEGSRTMYPGSATGYRANIEWWSTSSYANFLRRRALFKVFAVEGEVILLGSSAVGVDDGDILVYDPGTITGPVGNETIPATADFSCQTQRNATGNPDQGRITSRAQELAGPDTIPSNGVPGGYVPCFYDVTETGIYHIVFYGPAGGGSNAFLPPTGSIPDTPNNFNDQQRTSVSTWDVTVRSDLTSVDDIPGRLFANYLALFTGANPRPVNSTLYILTTDGFIYQTDLRGVDPNGFIIYANDVGFLNSDSPPTPLYRDILSDPTADPQNQNQLNPPLGGVSLAPPTHYIFFQEPDPAAIQANGVPLDPQVPEVTSLVFNGDLGGNNSSYGAGGVFTYISNINGSYELIISSGTNFDPTDENNRVLRGTGSVGTNTITWDGLDNAGNLFPVGEDYPVTMTVRAGEYHFPLLDVENSLDGGPQYTLLNPPGGVCPSFYGSSPNCNIAFYDDRGYTTANGTDIGTPGDTLPGNGQPSPNRSDPLTGFNTTTTQRAFGNGGADGFGDKKGLDLWTHFPSQPRGTALNIYAFNLLLAKTDGGVTVAPGDTLVYTLTYTNTGPVDATGVVITETVPVDTTFNQTFSTAGWSCADGSPAGTTCVFSLATVTGGTGGTVNFAVTVNAPLSVSQIDNTATIGDDGANGSEPPGDNTATENTPTTLAIVDPIITKSASPDTARPGEQVNFSITVLNPAPPSTANATNVILTDPLPREFDLVTYGVSSNPPGVLNSVTVTSDTISTAGHPSGITQTVVSTITVNILVLGLDQSVTLNVTAVMNNLASPPPLQVANFATLDFDEGNPRSASDSVRVPSTSSSDEDKDDDDGNDDGNASASSTATQPPAAADFTPPVLPVTLLPETGVGVTAVTSMTGWLLGWSLLGIGGIAVLYLWCKIKRG